MAIGHKIEAIKTAMRLTFPQMAKETGIADSTLRAYISGRNVPPYGAIYQIAIAYGVSLNWLLDDQQTADDGPIFYKAGEAGNAPLQQQIEIAVRNVLAGIFPVIKRESRTRPTQHRYVHA